MRESVLQKKCTSYLKKQNIYYINVHGDSWGSRGTPDILACINGKFVAFELKVGENELEPAQIIHRNKIKANNGLHFSIRTIKEFIDIVRGI